MDESRSTEILRRCRTGDEKGYRELVAEYQRPVYSLALRMLRGEEDAEDVTQETFVIGYRSIGTYRGEGTLGAWLGRIATRQALRRLGQRREAVSIEVAATTIDVGGLDPLGQSIAAERAGRVRAAVAALDEPYRETVALRFFAELSLNEIAEQTGRPLGTVKTHLHRGLARLRDAIGLEVAA